MVASLVREEKIFIDYLKFIEAKNVLKKQNYFFVIELDTFFAHQTSDHEVS
jgi:hypothetical protein